MILEAVASRLGLEKGIDKDDVSVGAVSNTQLIELKVRNLDPELAANIANTIPVVFIERSEALQLGRFSESKAALSQELSRVQADIELTQTAIKAIGSPNTAAEETELGRLQTALAQYRSNYATLLSNYEAIRLAEAQAMDSVIVFQEATVPGDPVLSNTKVNVLLAAAVGAALAIGIAFLVEYLDDTLKSPQDVSRVLGLTTLGTVARMRSKKRNGRSEGELVTTATPRSPVSEAFRTLRTNIQFSSVDKPIRRLLVTSAGPSDGKSITAINLAIVMAQSGQSVILIDTDLRRPVLHKALSLSNDKGITNRLLADPAGDLDGCLLPTGVENLRLLASGPLPPNPSELLGSQRMHKLIEQLEQQADVLIFDSPPVLAVTDAAVLAGQMDGVVLVIAAGGTREDMARRVLAELTQVGAPILGVVLNKVPVGRGGGYGYYYYRHYYADESRQSSSMPET